MKIEEKERLCYVIIRVLGSDMREHAEARVADREMLVALKINSPGKKRSDFYSQFKMRPLLINGAGDKAYRCVEENWDTIMVRRR